jgi:hypothetical protein
VLLKPNLGGIEWFKDPAKNAGDDGLVGRTTDPEFVRGVVQCLKARGHRTITIAEGFAHEHASWLKLVRTSGYEAMAKDEGVRLVALDDDGVFDVEGDQPGKPLPIRGIEDTGVPTLLLPKLLAEHLDHGLFVSLPKAKAHRFAVVTLGIKSLQGVVMYSDGSPAFHQKWRTHKELGPVLKALAKKEPDARARYVSSLETFAERMSDLLEIAAPDAVLVDGAPAMGGDGFGKQWPTKERFAFGGTNPILVDRVGAQLLGLWDSEALAKELGGHRTSPLVESAAKRFGVALDAPTVVGDGADLLSSPRPYHLVGMAGFELHSDQAPATPPVAHARAAAATDAGAPASAPELHAALASAAPVVDGSASDPAWSQATPVRFESDWSGAPTGIQTTVRALWTKDALYMLWELASAGLFVDRARPTSTEREKLYQEDCVELFLAPDAATRTRYLEIELGPAGHFFDLSVDRIAKRSYTTWSSAPTLATKEDPAAHKATIEVALRAPEIVRALTVGARLPLGLYRMEGEKPRHYLAWSPTRTPKPDFHVPDRFGWLVVD